MNKSVEEVCFNLVGGKVCYQDYLGITEQVKSLTEQAEGEMAAKFYEVLRLLINSENNAGWEDRHTARIDLINVTMDDLSYYYEKFLP